MPKLTADERERAIKELQGRLVNAIENSPRGLTEGEIRECILKACIEVDLITNIKAERR